MVRNRIDAPDYRTEQYRDFSEFRTKPAKRNENYMASHRGGGEHKRGSRFKLPRNPVQGGNKKHSRKRGRTHKKNGGMPHRHSGHKM